MYITKLSIDKKYRTVTFSYEYDHVPQQRCVLWCDYTTDFEILSRAFKEVFHNQIDRAINNGEEIEAPSPANSNIKIKPLKVRIGKKEDE